MKGYEIKDGLIFTEEILSSWNNGDYTDVKLTEFNVNFKYVKQYYKFQW